MDAKIVFFGTPAFALPVVDALFGAAYALQGVVTASSRPHGRSQKAAPLPVKEWAEEQGIAVFQPEKLDADFIATLRGVRPDVGIIAAYGKIIPQTVLDLFPKGVLNVHPSLLPRWRGPSPVQSAIVAADVETGVTVMLTDKEMDHGPILVQKQIILSGTEKGGELTATLFQEGAQLLVDTLPLWLEGKITAQPQKHLAATFSSLLTRESGRIDWTLEAIALERMVRAYDLWPGTFCEIPGLGRLKIFSIGLIPQVNISSSGTIFAYEGGFAVTCGTDSLEVITVQLEGKKQMSGKDFLRGHPEVLGKQAI